ncbi:hypothetical protein OPKNFCMD_3822 [Methylobacterium crusticola]|uniref:Pectate lyase superfamily protein domain-containing protein n=1 Tax=Methylobacterium crusticola TaxID=1697972 RepID=A0ABQ4R1B0_9HYPH|nr:hypothetical protein [Methylobacterium crusticola]GJD51071.1 hypothetical protein OPKNFCMD_3822 [Methylobacterium crusticola]
MAFPLINIGSAANDGTGDDLRTAFAKVNSFLAAYASPDGLATDIAAAASTALDSGVTLAKRISTGTVARAQVLSDWNSNRPLHLNDVIKPGTYGESDNLWSSINELANRARERNTSFELPAGKFLCNGEVDLQFTEVVGAGSGIYDTTTVHRQNAGDMFVSLGHVARLRRLRLRHEGVSGKALALRNGDAHRIDDVGIDGLHPAATDSLMTFFGSNCRFDNLSISSLRAASSYCLECLSSETSGNININNVISGLYMGGTSSGVHVGSSDGSRRPEGLHFIAPQSVIVGGPAFTVGAILQLVIVAPMLDQVKGYGILIKTEAPYGVSCVQVIGGWIGSSSVTDPNAVGIGIDNGSPIASANVGGVVVTGGTGLRYLKTGIDVIGQTQDLTVDDSVQFSDLASGICIDAPDLNWIKTQLTVGSRIKVPAGAQLIRNKATGRGGLKKSRKTFSIPTSGFSGYVGGDHGLVAPPATLTVGFDVGTATMQPPGIQMATKDLNNVVLNAQINGIVAHGTGTVTVDMEV